MIRAALALTCCGPQRGRDSVRILPAAWQESSYEWHKQDLVAATVWSHIFLMKTNLSERSVLAWSVRFGIAAVALAFATSGFALPVQHGTAKNKIRIVRAAGNQVHKDCYVMLSGSPFPQPVDRLGSTPSTASPMAIIGEAPVLRCRR